MSNPTTSDSSKRLAVLERRMKLLEQALTAEQKKTAEMQKVIAVYANDLEQTLDIYDKAFGQSATAVQQSSDAQVEAAAAKQEAETTAQIVDKLADSVMSDQGGP